jgi:hypothetical protein
LRRCASAPATTPPSPHGCPSRWGNATAPLRALLHVGFAQLDALALPAHAAVAATVDAARALAARTRPA